MKKYITAAAILLSAIVLLCSCSLVPTPPRNDADHGQVQDENNGITESTSAKTPDTDAFIRVLGTLTPDRVLGIYPDDYNCDGKYEAYAVTSISEKNPELVHDAGVSVWFVREDGAELLLSGDYAFTPQIWEFDDKKLFCIDGYKNGTAESLVYFVSDKHAYSYGDFGAKLIRDSDTENSFTALVADNDAAYNIDRAEYFGETTKPYYLYFDGNFFCEYGGITVRADQLRAVPGADEILTAISDGGYTVGNIYYRSNGIVNVNISKADSNNLLSQENVTLRIADGNAHLLLVEKNADDSAQKNNEPENTDSEKTLSAEQVIADNFASPEVFSYSGNYIAAVLPDIAVYPQNMMNK